MKIIEIDKEKNMSNIIDGFNFNVPTSESQIIALANHHRILIDEAIFHQEIHLVVYCLD